MNLNIIDTLMERMEIHKKMISGARNTEEWSRVINTLNSNHEDSLRGYYNMLSEEDQLTVYNLMNENQSKYAYQLLHWISFMPEWQRVATRFLV